MTARARNVKNGFLPLNINTMLNSMLPCSLQSFALCRQDHTYYVGALFVLRNNHDLLI